MHYKIFVLSFFVVLLVSCEPQSEKLEFSKLSVKAHADDASGGKSTIELITSNQEEIHFKANLVKSDAVAYPYWQVSLIPQDEVFSLKGVKTISLSFKEEVNSPIDIMFFVYYEGVSQKGNYNTYAPLVYTSNSPGSQINASIMSFDLANWWIELNKLDRKEIINSDLHKNISMIAITNAPEAKGMAEISITDISLKK